MRCPFGLPVGSPADMTKCPGVPCLCSDALVEHLTVQHEAGCQRAAQVRDPVAWWKAYGPF